MQPGKSRRVGGLENIVRRGRDQHRGRGSVARQLRRVAGADTRRERVNVGKPYAGEREDPIALRPTPTRGE